MGSPERVVPAAWGAVAAIARFQPSSAVVRQRSSAAGRGFGTVAAGAATDGTETGGTETGGTGMRGAAAGGAAAGGAEAGTAETGGAEDGA